MKLAIISDIKSNVYALEAVLADAKNKEVDAILNLGDMFYGPIDPRATYELIRESKFINISGNEDRQILEASLEQLEEDELLRFVYNELGEDVLYWIQDLPFEKLIGENYYMIHGTYFDDSQYLLEDIENGQIKQRDDKEIIKLTDDIKSIFIMCGGSHLPQAKTLNSGQIVINPGSVGLQALKATYPSEHIIENNTADAAYSVLTIEDQQYSIEQVNVAYDYEKAALKAEENGNAKWAHALRTGTVLK